MPVCARGSRGWNICVGLRAGTRAAISQQPFDLPTLSPASAKGSLSSRFGHRQRGPQPLTCIWLRTCGPTVKRRKTADTTLIPQPPKIAKTRSPALRNAMQDLEEAAYAAVEDEFPEPSRDALTNARRILRAVYEIAPGRYEIYPTPDGEVAIDAAGAACSVLLLCDSNGGALCLVNMNGEHRRARYSSTGFLPDGFVRDALAELTERTAFGASCSQER